MSTRAELIQRGYGHVLAVRIEGIPHVFAERLPKRVDAAATPTLPADYASASGALMLRDGSSISIEVSTEGNDGIAGGSPFEFVLAKRTLEDEGLNTSLFSYATWRAQLDGDLASSATSIPLADASDVPVSGSGNLGRERVSWTGKSTNTLTGVTRAILGHAYEYIGDSPTTYGRLTDKPQIWVGRFVEIHEHLVSPEGRMLDSTWLTGTHHRVIWRGFVDATPTVDGHGVTLRALPLCRLPALPVGQEVVAEVVVPTNELLPAAPIVYGPQSQIRLDVDYTDGITPGTTTVVVPTPTADVSTTIRGWARVVQTALDNALTGEPWYTAFSAEVGARRATSFDDEAPYQVIDIWMRYGSAYHINSAILTIPDTPALYWLAPGAREGDPEYANQKRLHWSKDWPVARAAWPSGSWLPVVQTEGEGHLDLSLPDAGIGVLESESGRELVRWDAKISANAPQFPGAVMLRLSARGLYGTGPVQLLEGATLTVASGHVGTLREILLTVLQSSGTGDRGAFDTLLLGQGYGIPEDWVDLDSFDRFELSDLTVAAVVEGRASLGDVVGGWLALNGLCLAQVLDPDEGARLAIVEVDPRPVGPSTPVIGLGDVALGDMPDRPDVPDPVNEISIDRSGIDEAVPVLWRDLGMIQADHARSMEYSAPGMPEALALQLAATRVEYGLGQLMLELPVAPWAAQQPGDLADLTIAHPGTYRWDDGAWSPPSLAARVRGWRYDLVTRRQHLTIAMAGAARPGLYLAPTTIITTVGISDVKVRSNAEFADGFKVRIYEPANEGTNSVEMTITTVSGTDTMAFTAALPGWVAAGHLVTYADHPVVDAVQDTNFLYVRSDKEWEA